jgi:argininosuccinate lyase
MDLSGALDPRAIIESRKGTGGAAPAAVGSMIRQCEQKADDLTVAVQQRRQMVDEAERQLLAQARLTAREVEVTDG